MLTKYYMFWQDEYIGYLDIYQNIRCLYDKHTKGSIIPHSVYYQFFIATIILDWNYLIVHRFISWYRGLVECSCKLHQSDLYNLGSNWSFCNYKVFGRQKIWFCIVCIIMITPLKRKKKLSIIYCMLHLSWEHFPAHLFHHL